MGKNTVREALPGVILAVSGVLASYIGGVCLSALPATASFALFFTASLVSKDVLKKWLSRFYSWRYFDTVSPLLFIVPLILVLHTGYEYAYAGAERVLELTASMLIGIGVFLAAYTALRVV